MSPLLWLHDPRLRPLALGPLPAWLWSEDARHVLWANPTAAAIFGAPSAAALATRNFDAGQPTAAQVAHLVKTLPPDGVRLERLRGFGAGIGRTLTCSCSRLTLADGAPAVLVAATERSGPDLPLKERVTRLLAGNGEALAAFAADGTLIHATPAARSRLADKASLASLGADALAAVARQNGHTTGDSFNGPVEIDRVGEAAEPVLIVALDAGAERRAPATVPSQAEVPLLEPLAAAVTTASRPQPDDRRHPLRFVWQMDAEGRFTIDSQEFVETIGPRGAALLGQPWQTIASTLQLDPEGLIARAITTRDTWSGVTIGWPVDGSDECLSVELSGLPVFDRDRRFRGYRGFGVCRDITRIDTIVNGRQPAQGTVLTLHLPDEADAPSLSPVERHAFLELSRRLAGHINNATAETEETAAPPVAEPPQHPDATASDRLHIDHEEQAATTEARPFLDRLPFGVLVYHLSHLLYANDAFLTWSGYASLDALAEDGGLDSLLIEPGAVAIEEGGKKSFAITSPRDQTVAEARLLLVPWEGESAFALLTIPPSAEAAERANAPLEQARAQAAERDAILDTATDGVIVIDRAARIVASNRSAQALFGHDAHELEGKIFSDLFAAESLSTAIEYLDGLQGSGVASLLNDGREVIGRERNGGEIPLFMTMGRLADGEKFCAVFRDITQWKKTEGELIAARREAERASAAKSDFLAKISHEIRTPLNAVIGFSEVMMEERFGPVGNDRYRQYLTDIHASGGHLLSLINDLLDLSKIEAGKLELTFANVSINDLTQQCVAIMQPQATRERIIIRTSLSPRLPQVVADARSVRQIVLNLLSNSIKFTGAGGQVIVATALNDRSEVVLRVRDTGIGMSEKDIATAMEPFRQLATATQLGSGGTGLGLPLTKALAEANRANFHIKSAPKEGTLVEITFSGARVLAQ